MTEARLLVVMGVSGSGKSSVARALAARLRCPFLEGDDLHSDANVALMAAGTPLTDADRTSWLDAIARWLQGRAAAGADAVVACSALKRSYRDLLRSGCPSLVFVHLNPDPDELARRMGERTGHFMPASLLPSQVAILEPLGPDEAGVTMTSDGSVEAVVDDVVRRLDLPEASADSSAPTDPLD